MFLQILGIMNILALVAYIWDHNAKKQRGMRIPTILLFLLALLGGGFGAVLAMYTCSHLLEKPEFKIGVPFLCGIQGLIIIVVSTL